MLSASPEIEDVIKAVGEITQLLERHGGENIAARISKTCGRLSEGDLDALATLLAETTAGMGSLNDFGFGPEAERGGGAPQVCAHRDRRGEMPGRDAPSRP